MPSSRSRGSGRGSDGAPRTQVLAPMSERQQLALIMQISSLDAPPASPNPAEERKRTRQQRNERGETPLHVAAIRGDHELVKKHLQQGQDPDCPDFAGWTPLHEACSYGWYQVVEVLVNGGANVNAKGLDDDTPLHDATTSGNLQMVKFLVQHGADAFAKNTKGKMPSDYAAPHIYEYLMSLKDSNTRNSHGGRARDDNKKGGNASRHSKGKHTNMETLTQGDNFDGKNVNSQDKRSLETRDENMQLSNGVVSSTQDDTAINNKQHYIDDIHENDVVEDDGSKRNKRKETEEREPMGKPPPPAPRGGQGRFMTGSKPPGPASKTGGGSMGKGGGSVGSSKGGSGGSSGKSGQQSHGKGSGSGKGSNSSHQSKSSSGSKGGSGSSSSKQERKSPVASPKIHVSRDHHDGDGDDHKIQDSSGPKVPPLKIVIPGGGSGNRNEQEDGQRGSGKGRGSGTLPYVIPCTSTDMGQTSDSSDGNYDDKRSEGGKTGHRVLRSHRTNDGEKDKDKERISPLRGSGHFHSSKSPLVAGSSHDDHSVPSTSRGEPDLHPRKRKMKSSKDSHARESKNDTTHESSTLVHNVTHCNPYQMFIHIRKQIDRRQKSLFPVKPKPPKDFNNYLMNRCNYTLQSNVTEPQVDIPHTLPPQLINDFLEQERERHRLRVQHLVEKEKLVLAVEQEILRVHGRAERAVANQSLPYSACTILRDKEVYNVLAPEQEEKRNAQRSRCNGRQINSWLQEVDDKWEKIKEGMLRRQHTEAQSLHAVQTMTWQWRLKELGLADYKVEPKGELLQNYPFPVVPEKPKNFDKYRMPHGTTTLQENSKKPEINIPNGLPRQLIDVYLELERERHRLKIRHLIEKDKLLVSVEEELMRVCRLAEGDESLLNSTCRVLSGEEPSNVFALEIERKLKAKKQSEKSRIYASLIDTGLEELDDKWEILKVDLLKRQKREAQSLYAAQIMSWQWRLVDLDLADYHVLPEIDPTHVPNMSAE